MPPERPQELKPAIVPAAPETPLPPERPPELTPAAPGAAPAAEAPSPPLPPARPPELSGEAALALKVAAPDDGACRIRLKRLGATFEALPRIENGQCGAASPVKLTALEGVALPQSATLVCGAAEALARWATEAQAASESELGAPLKAIAIGTSYECRGQNHDPDAKLSEHAYANGIDVMSFSVEGRAPISVVAAPDGTPEARFLATVRARACGFFRTVLGPGSDAAHANHLHLDERERGSGHRLCQ
ncbi:extensin family protein [Methylobacterium durans]|nr:extensin family protein [Methylobacterium durans]MEA1830733.1 extensin family protein [Methylobacterium durans]